MLTDMTRKALRGNVNARINGCMEKPDAVSLAIDESRNAGGDRRYAVMWPDGHWTVETYKPYLAGPCILAVDGVLEHA